LLFSAVGFDDGEDVVEEVELFEKEVVEDDDELDESSSSSELLESLSSDDELPSSFDGEAFVLGADEGFNEVGRFGGCSWFASVTVGCASVVGGLELEELDVVELEDDDDTELLSSASLSFLICFMPSLSAMSLTLLELVDLDTLSNSSGSVSSRRPSTIRTFWFDIMVPCSSKMGLLAVFMLSDIGIFDELGVSEGDAAAEGMVDEDGESEDDVEADVEDDEVESSPTESPSLASLFPGTFGTLPPLSPASSGLDGRVVGDAWAGAVVSLGCCVLGR
jgi:hypothetical protein